MAKGSSNNPKSKVDLYHVSLAVFISLLAWPSLYVVNNGFQKIDQTVSHINNNSFVEYCMKKSHKLKKQRANKTYFCILHICPNIICKLNFVLKSGIFAIFVPVPHIGKK